MSDDIRYAWGESTLGAFIAAQSMDGLVAFEFADRGSPLDRLRERLPQSTLREDAAGLAAIVAALSRLVDRPDEASDIALDPRGSDYEKRVWSLLREIPAGTTVSYGEIAARMGTRDARDVTAAIAANGIAILVPCHRVLKKDGSLSGYRWGARRKRALLERERR
ncbi:MAG: methylated-DNA--[protein]-cysteine S-methyltransferase [Reyranella sp.]|uniref:methylated-DNA--[protein]-cysteine S-methyltransferase n=1 Tax=Reyranella sp. TaxID=1929291 RepID=UPI001ACD7021|nr:methylated-DNA--[protein]-cysteine S-methyltransferase [Reyranella sp.]MBN9089354.1 methylated-DNA--[protein]-cysteine S-methyltransferase [Reyranella sp.]